MTLDRADSAIVGSGRLRRHHGYGTGVTLAPTPSGRLPRWHCIATNYGQQFLAETAVSADGWRTYFPLHLDRRSDRIGPMFPGYGFVEFDANADDWPRICRARGVYQLLGRTGKPTPLPVGQVEALQERTSARRIVDDPGVDWSRARARVSPGERGRVVDGPLTGWEGLCTQSGQARVRLLLTLFGTQREVEFKPALVVGAA